jgi:hypothetical protein
MEHTNCPPSNAQAFSVAKQFYYMLFVGNPEFAVEEVRLSKSGGLSDADEIMARKLREKGILPTMASLSEALLNGISRTKADLTKSELIHVVTKMVAQKEEAGLDESAGGSSSGAGGGSSNRSTTAPELLRRRNGRRTQIIVVLRRRRGGGGKDCIDCIWTT